MITSQTVDDIINGNPPKRAWICHEEPTDEPLIWYEDNSTTAYVIKACRNEHPQLPCGWYELTRLPDHD